MAEPATSIYRSIELREYDKLENLAKMIISEKGWNKFLGILSKSQVRGAVIPGWNIPVKKGCLRDALVRLLGLETIIGLDCNYITNFNQIESNDLTDVRNQAFPIAIDLLREQVETRNTFFLDTDTFSTTPYAVFVKDIISARTAEIEALPSKPSLRQVYETYYGFTVLTSGRTSSYRAGASEQGVKYIEDLAAQFGNQTKLNARIFQPSKKAFENCTPETKEILWDILRMFNGGYDTRSNAAKKLGQIGDSRATEFIVMNYQNSTNHYFKPALIKALGSIGDPKGLDCVLKALNDSRLRKVAIISLGSIRHPETLKQLVRMKEANNQSDLGSVITALGNTRSEGALDILSSIMNNRRGRIVQKAIEALCSFGKRGFEKVTRDPSRLVKALKPSKNLHKMMHFLKKVPDFLWTVDLQKTIARTIRQTTNAYRIIDEIYTTPELSESNFIIDAILDHIRRMTRYRWTPWHFTRLLQGGKVQRLLGKAIRTSDRPQILISKISQCPELKNHPEIESAIKFVKRRDDPPPRSDKDWPFKRIIAKQISEPKDIAALQETLIAYLDNLADSATKQTEE